MKQTKYTCDCCGKEVKSEDDLETFGVRENDVILYDICKECEDKLEEAIYKEFYKIKNNNKKERYKNVYSR